MKPHPAQLSLFELLAPPAPAPAPAPAPEPEPAPQAPDLSPLQAEARPLPGRLWSDVLRAEAQCWRAAGDPERADALERRANGMGSHRVAVPLPIPRMDRRPKLMFRRMEAGPCQLEVWALNPETDGWRCVRTVRPTTAADESLSVVELLSEFHGLHVCARPKVLTPRADSATVSA